MSWLEKLLEGQTLEGEEAVKALHGLGWRSAVQAALVLLEDGEIERAKAILEELLADEAIIDRDAGR